MSRIFDIIITFFYIFGFSFKNGTGLDSTMLVFAFLCFKALYGKKYFNLLIKFFRTSYFRNIVICYFLINILCIFSIFANDTNDYSFLKTFFHMFFLIVTGCLLFVYFSSKCKSKYIVENVVICFIVQTIIEWLAYIFPSIKNIVNYTKSYATIIKGQSYSGIRGNALAASDFFGLSVSYACILLLFFSKKNSIFKSNKFIRLLLYTFIVSGTFFAGRTGFIGLLIALVYLVFTRLNIKEKNFYSSGFKVKKITFYILPIILISFLFLSRFLNEFSQNEKALNLLNFAFQLIISKKTTGSINVSSLQSLEHMYRIKIPFITYIIGDGRYTLENGKYYMGTDVGYLRVILFIGFVGMISLLIMEMFIIAPLKGDERKLKFFIIILLLILNFKGEVIVWSQILLSMILLFVLQDIFIETKDGWGFNYEINNSFNDNL